MLPPVSRSMLVLFLVQSYVSIGLPDRGKVFPVPFPFGWNPCHLCNRDIILTLFLHNCEVLFVGLYSYGNWFGLGWVNLYNTKAVICRSWKRKLLKSKRFLTLPEASPNFSYHQKRFLRSFCSLFQGSWSVWVSSSWWIVITQMEAVMGETWELLWLGWPGMGDLLQRQTTDMCQVNYNAT